MSEAIQILSVGAGTLLAIVVFAVIVFWFIEDVTQKKHAVLRNYPVIGRLRFFFEDLSEYFRQYFSPMIARKCRSTARRTRFRARNRDGSEPRNRFRS